MKKRIDKYCKRKMGTKVCKICGHRMSIVRAYYYIDSEMVDEVITLATGMLEQMRTEFQKKFPKKE